LKEGQTERTVESLYSHPFSLNEMEIGSYTKERLVTEASKPECF